MPDSNWSLPDEQARRLDAAKAIALAAGQEAMRFFADYQNLSHRHKDNEQDIVTEADTHVEMIIRDAIVEAFPGDGLIGEEYGVLETASRYQWLIDPIDGTSCFAHGLASWCTVICVVENGRPVLGVIYAPLTGELFWTGAGIGSYRNDQPIRVDHASRLTSGIVAIGGSHPVNSQRTATIIGRLMSAGGAYMRNGSAALTLAQVAAGHYVGYFEPGLRAWDCAAGLLLVSEAGGVIGDFVGLNGLLGRGDVFAAVPQIAPELRSMINA